MFTEAFFIEPEKLDAVPLVGFSLHAGTAVRRGLQKKSGLPLDKKNENKKHIQPQSKKQEWKREREERPAFRVDTGTHISSKNDNRRRQNTAFR